MGPIQIFLLGFDDLQATGGIATELTALSAAGTIRVVEARLLLRESANEVVAVRVRDLADSEREDLRAAAAALACVDSVALGGREVSAADPILGTDAALDVDELGLCEAEIGQLAEELPVGEALLLFVIENVWAARLANSLRESGVVFAQQDYVSSEGLAALGDMLGLAVADQI